MAEATQADSALHPAQRSCHRCNRRKVRCNKTQPCDNCSKSKSECVFPGPGRAPRRQKRPLKAELVSRLKSLEQEIRALTRDRDELAAQSSDTNSPVHETSRAESGQDVSHQRGRLLVEGTSNQYVSHEVLIGLRNKIGELNELVGTSQNNATDPGETPDGEEDYSQSGLQFIFGYSSMATSLTAFHPSMAHSQVLYKLFEENVAPVLMIFHKPCLLKMIFKAAGNIDNLDPPSEAVVFAVYFAAINSMDPKRCPELLSQDHSFLLERYRFATQQALARAGLLQLRNQMVLQAAVLFLTCLRRPEDAHFVWTMTAAVLRAAQGIGLHRDGTNFGLSPFEVEMRRRLWWSIYLLDSQSSELQAIDKQITEDSYDTRMPLNINDSDLSPDMTQLPEPRSSFTEMTFCLVRIEMIVLYSRSALSAVGDRNYSNSRGGNQDGSLVLEERLRQLGQIINRLREQYLKFCDTSVPVQWVTATIIRLALARSWLVAHFSRDVNAEGMPAIETPADDPSRDQLFAAATEVVEFALLLETDPRTMNWSWFFRGYPQWHAVMFVLSELLIRSRAADTDRAWAMVNRAVARWMERDARKGSIVFETVYHLMIRAAAAHNRVWHGPRNGDADELWTVPWESM